MNVVVIDNYDSFTFNLAQSIGTLGATVDVHRNDMVTLDALVSRTPDAVVISPGPGVPKDAGISLAVVRWCERSRTPLFGVCLGQQVIVEAFGGRIIRTAVRHGKTSRIFHSSSGIFRGVPEPFDAMRYHSLVCEAETMPDELRVEAWTDDALVMAVTHRTLPMWGVQFHPESVLTPDGPQLIRNFLELAAAPAVTGSSRP